MQYKYLHVMYNKYGDMFIGHLADNYDIYTIWELFIWSNNYHFEYRSLSEKFIYL